MTNTLALIGRVGREQAAATRRLLTKAEGTATEKDSAASDLTEEAAMPLASTTSEVGPGTSGIAAVTTEVAPFTNVAAGSAIRSRRHRQWWSPSRTLSQRL